MKSSYPKVSIIYDRYNKSSRTRGAMLEIRISYNYKQKYISTGIKLLPNQWKKETIVNHQNKESLNKFLKQLVSDINQAIAELYSEGSIDLKHIPQRIELIKGKKETFLQYCKKRSIIRKYGKTPDSQKRYDRFMKAFTMWGKIVYFEDISDINIIAFDEYLKTKNLKNYSKWNNYHRFLNSFIIDAINEGLIRRNPYKQVNIIKDKSYTGIGKYLTLEEFNTIKNKDMPTESLERVRDTFVFQTYTCMSYTDLRDFNSEMIVDINNVKTYISNRRKTNKQFTIPLQQPALDILHKYNNKLPIISNVKYNEYLKIVAQVCGIDKPISSHWARHTGATLLLNAGVSMNIVSKICGHSSIKITEKVYAKLLDDTIVKALKNTLF